MSSTLIETAAPARQPAPVTTGSWGATVWQGLLAANLVALLAAALFLRTWQLDRIPTFHEDEAWLGLQAKRLAAGEAISWRTPTGGPVDPFLLLPMAGLEAVFPPSVELLRALAVAGGVAAVAVNFWLCRRVLDRRTALVSTATLAVLPIAIAFSRVVSDASQTLLATVLVAYFGLTMVERRVTPAGEQGDKRRPSLEPVPPDWLPVLLAFGAAIWIHPTNVFAIWLLIVPAVYRYHAVWRFAAGAAWERTAGTWAGWIARGAALTICTGALAAGGWFCRGLLATAAARLIDADQGELFLRRLVGLFSGGTIFETFPGADPASVSLDAIDLALMSLAAVAVLGLNRRLRHDDSGRERSLAWAGVLMIGSFYLVAGPAALAPDVARYGLCLVAPCGILLALGWSHCLGKRGFSVARPQSGVAAKPADVSRRKIQARLAGVLLSIMAWLWLALFFCNYFGGHLVVAGQPRLPIGSAVTSERPAQSVSRPAAFDIGFE